MTSRGKRGVVRGVPAIISLAVLATALSLMAATAEAAPTCGGAPASKARFLGTDGRDTITGTNQRDIIIGLDGFDTIKGRGGRDIICGAADDLVEHSGNKLIGGDGVDDLTG